ncbi:MAG TPA: palindromic element RPE4 domain-containing protein [Rickettsia endosymbiont of Pyrocoelia pectoralis]|nr:palindromic element RPE4 domain-containing protein [Rickettsia endosymbiont of Pyrocoelia pectoralis]
MVFLAVFLDPVVKPRGDTEGFSDPRNNAITG